MCLVVASTGSTKSTCPVDLGPILNEIGLPPAPNVPIGRYPLRVWKGHEHLAKSVYAQIEEGQIAADQLHSLSKCFSPPLNDSDFTLALSAEFRDRSLARIRKINPAAFERASKVRPIENLALRIFDGHSNHQDSATRAIGDRPAGYHITTQSLFMDIAKVSKEDWDAIFIHEIGHFVDPVMSHVRFFNNEKMIEKIGAIVQKENRGELVEESEIQILDQWLYHGVNIRLLAEWRVWSFTVNYLRGGNNADITLGPETVWLKPYLRSTVSEMDWKRDLFLELDKNFHNPSEGVFSSPLLQQRMGLLREKLRQQAVHEKCVFQ